MCACREKSWERLKTFKDYYLQLLNQTLRPGAFLAAGESASQTQLRGDHSVLAAAGRSRVNVGVATNHPGAETQATPN